MKIRVPQNSREITLEMFRDYKCALDDVERVITITGLSREDVLKLLPATMKEVISIFETSLTLGYKERPTIVRVKTKNGSMKLGFLPDINEITYGEWADADNYSKEIYEDAEYSSVHKLVGILFRPVDVDFMGQYSLKPYDSNNLRFYEQFILNLTMDKVFSALAFFLQIGNELQMTGRGYLIQELKNQVTKVRQATEHLRD